MKTAVIIISDRFPIGHRRAGEKTYFVEKILAGEKLHTLRTNLPWWLTKNSMLNTAQMCLSIRRWSGKPYRSKQQEIIRLSGDGIGVESVSLQQSSIEQVAKNDGLNLNDFNDWFRKHDRNIPVAAVHFTDFRYGEKQ